eukprot:912028-Rhodomonas_salina.3
MCAWCGVRCVGVKKKDIVDAVNEDTWRLWGVFGEMLCAGRTKMLLCERHTEEAGGGMMDQGPGTRDIVFKEARGREEGDREE